MISKYILKKYNFKVDFGQFLSVLRRTKEYIETTSINYSRTTGEICIDKRTNSCDNVHIYAYYHSNRNWNKTAEKIILSLQKEMAEQECTDARRKYHLWGNELDRRNYIEKKAKFLAILQKHDKLFFRNRQLYCGYIYGAECV